MSLAETKSRNMKGSLRRAFSRVRNSLSNCAVPDLGPLVERLTEATARLDFAAPVHHVYRPLEYAAEAHASYLDKYAGLGASVLLLGMNPGPFGMCQTGIPFGDVQMVREWLGIGEGVREPGSQHKARPILGFKSKRAEVSGTRIWGWAARRFKHPEDFFGHFFVWNYCPLAFLEESGRNRTPDKLPRKERDELFDTCDTALKELVDQLGFRQVLGVGRFAGQRAKVAFTAQDIKVGDAPHPSPASPAANRDWVGSFERALAQNGIQIPAR